MFYTPTNHKNIFEKSVIKYIFERSNIKNIFDIQLFKTSYQIYSVNIEEGYHAGSGINVENIGPFEKLFFKREENISL